MPRKITLKPLAYGEEITPQIIAHYSKDNELVEIEVLDANEIFSKKMPYALSILKVEDYARWKSAFDREEGVARLAT